jgi:hypothetical protein
MRLPVLLASGLAIVLCGCQEVTIVDDVDFELNWDPLTGPSDALHTPYVQGAGFNLWIHTTKKESLRGWTVQSGDETVMSLGTTTLSNDEEDLHLSAKAGVPGRAELRVVDPSGDVRHRHEVDVKFPDRVDILPHGPLLIHRSGVGSEERPQVLHDGTATFLVQYYLGGEQLSGHGGLGVRETTGIGAHVETTSFLEDRDWLVIEASQAGITGELGLLVAGTEARRLTVDTIAEAGIDRMALSGESEGGASDKEWLVVLAEAFDAMGRVIYGTEFRWTADDKVQTGGTFGDLYRYSYDAKQPVMLEAAHGLHTDGVLIHSRGGFVDSTNRLGCSTVPGGASTGSMCSMMALVALLLLRRRRLSP